MDIPIEKSISSLYCKEMKFFKIELFCRRNYLPGQYRVLFLR